MENKQDRQNLKMNANRFLKLVILLYIVAGSVLLLGPESLFPSFYKLNFMASLAFVSVFLMLLPSFIFKTSDESKKRTRSALESNIGINLLLNGAGGLGLYKLYLIGFEYDKLTHFVTPFLLTVGIYSFLRVWYELKHIETLIFVATGIFVAGIGWEMLEYLSDFFSDTQLLGGGSAQIFKDTAFDMVANTLGIITAGIYIILKKNKK